jgi:3',5'-cyclic AMP phosphodiesterase CpdA
MKRTLFLVTLFASSFCTPLTTAQQLTLPNAKDSFRFAVIGDTGTGGAEQRKIGEDMAAIRKTFPFDVVVMMGDNLYGGESPNDFKKKFELPYATLLSGGVKFYASLGNHDNANQRFYKNFNMDGKRYYTFKPRDGIRFFALDSNYMDKEQLDWLDKELAASGADWKIVFFHHPLYSSGETHGSSQELRTVLEPIFLKHAVSLVLAGHEHFYERLRPQRGIPYFIVGSSAKLRKGDLKQNSELTAKGFDSDNVFMLCEIHENTLQFQVLSRTGKTIDSGSVERPNVQSKAAAGQ